MSNFLAAYEGRLQRQDVPPPPPPTVEQSFRPFDYLDDEIVDDTRYDEELNPQFTIQPDLLNRVVYSVRL